MKKLALILMAVATLGGCASTSTSDTKKTFKPRVEASVKYDSFDKVWHHRSMTYGGGIFAETQLVAASNDTAMSDVKIVVRVEKPISLREARDNQGRKFKVNFHSQDSHNKINDYIESGTWRLHSTGTLLRSKTKINTLHYIQVPWEYMQEVFSNQETKGFKLRATGRRDQQDVFVMREQYDQIVLQLSSRNK